MRASQALEAGSIPPRRIFIVMIRIKERTGEQIKVMTTDGWMAYENTIKKVFVKGLA